MSDERAGAYAKVTLTLEIHTGDSWGEDCSLKQVYDQGRSSALGMIENWRNKDPSVAQRVRVIGTPTVEAVTSIRKK